MRLRRCHAFALACVVPYALAAAQPPARPMVPRADDAVAITNVHVVPMDRDTVLRDRTVIIRDGRIVSIERTKPPGLANTRVIDGAGAYVLPGLADMHAHLQPGAGSLDDNAGRQLALMVTYGVTTMRILAGPPTSLALRDSTARGAIVGPRIVAFSPSLNGNSLRDARLADSLVRSFKGAGYEGLKTHGGFDSLTYDSLVTAARRYGMRLSGHVTAGYSLARAMDAGQQIEHLDGFIRALLPPSFTDPPAGQIVFDDRTLDAIDARRIGPLAGDFARRRRWNGPTLGLFETIANDSTPEELQARANMRFVAPSVAEAWTNQRRQIQQQTASATARQKFIALRRQIVRSLDSAGAPLLAGSDSPQAFLTPGDALHRELEAFVAAGLSPYRALLAATRNPAVYLGMEDSSGTLAPGKRADLVLVSGNPLESIANVRHVRGTMIGGRWYDSAALDAIRAAVADRVAPRSSPSVGYGASMTYDAARGQVLLFGGAELDSDGRPRGLATDLWSWDGATWRKLVPDDGVSPPGRMLPHLAYIASEQRVLMFGGRRETEAGRVELPSDVWEWDGRRWHRRADSLAILHASVADDPRTKHPLVFGGLQATGVSRALREWDGNAWRVRDRTGPPVGSNPLLAVASAVVGDDVVIVTEQSGNAADSAPVLTWTWSAGRWTRREPGPAITSLQATATASDGTIYIYQMPGPWLAVPILHTRSPDGRWTSRSLPVQPTGQLIPAAAYDAHRRRFVLHGVFRPGGPPETWEFDGTAWNRVLPP